MQTKEYSVEIEGIKITAEFTDLADQANGSVIIRSGNTAVLVTAVMSSEENKSAGYFPLRVDYEERFYASGQILGSQYVRREGRPSDQAILSGRIVDRTIRPLFEQYIRHDIQVIATVISIGNYNPDTLAVLGASLAIATSNIPWNGPVSALRIGLRRNDTSFTINPDYSFNEDPSKVFESVICGKEGIINMIEVGASEITEAQMSQALTKAEEIIKELQQFQDRIISERKKEKTVIQKTAESAELIELFQTNIIPQIEAAVFSGAGKDNINSLKKIWFNLVAEKSLTDRSDLVEEYFEHQVDTILHEKAISSERRADGRDLDEIRPLFAKAGGISEQIHGTGIFYRGGTHVFSALTLGGPGDSQTIEGMENSFKKHFMHHYNFPPFSTGEIGSVGGSNRRAVGHGALAEKALLAIIPEKEIFPYTIRIVSEAFASNGSTSMASVCGSTLALMDAGVPIKSPVAGIAMGLMMKDHTQYKILTDIQGPEDHHGDMDLKVAGTRNGITAIQMDVKVDGIPTRILIEAIEKAKTARHKILDVIENEIKEPRKEISPLAPQIIIIKINPEKIGMVIGTGGKTINGIKDETGIEIDIEDDGSVFITGKKEGALRAKELVEAIVKEYKVGDILNGIVTKVVEFGAFVSIDKNTEGLVHVSEMASFRINDVSTIIKKGDSVPVKVIKVEQNGKIGLSIKAANPDFFQQAEQSNGTK